MDETDKFTFMNETLKLYILDKKHYETYIGKQQFFNFEQHLKRQKRA